MKGYSRYMLKRTGAVLCLIFLYCGGCADQWLLHPSTKTMDAKGARRVMLKDEGRKIEVFVARSRGVKSGNEPQAYVLEFCGNATRAEEVATQWAGLWGS